MRACESGLSSGLLPNRQKERGGSRVKALLWTVVLLAGAYAAFKVIPVCINNYMLQDKLTTEARFSIVNHRSDDELREVIFREIQERDIPARKEDIKIVENTRRGVSVTVDYNVPVDLKVYQLTLHFNPSADNRALY
jgi:hypothetical protein